MIGAEGDAAAAGFPLDQVIDRVLARIDREPRDSPADVYVWEDGRVTGPPTAHEPTDTRVVALVTPGPERPTPSMLRESILRGLDALDARPPA